MWVQIGWLTLEHLNTMVVISIEILWCFRISKMKDQTNLSPHI